MHVWAWCSACRSPQQANWDPCCFRKVLLLGKILLCRLLASVGLIWEVLLSSEDIRGVSHEWHGISRRASALQWPGAQ